MDIDDRKLVAWINPVDGSTPIITVDAVTNNTRIGAHGSGVVFDKPLAALDNTPIGQTTPAAGTFSNLSVGSGGSFSSPVGLQSSLVADIANLPTWSYGVLGNNHDARPTMAYTVITPTGATSNVWENLNSFVTVNPGGTLSGEINVIHAHFQANAGTTFGSGTPVETFEASATNSAAMETFTGYLHVFNNNASGTVQVLQGQKYYLNNLNTTAGAIANYAAIEFDAMVGGGSAPTNYYFIKNAEPLAKIATLGGVVIGSLAGSNVAGTVQIIGPDNLAGTLPLKVTNQAGTIILSADGTGAVRMQGGSLSVGASGTLGKVFLFNGTSGSIQLNAPATGALSGTVTVPNATDTLVGRATTDTLTNKTLTDFVNTQVKRVSAQTDVTSSTALANVTGLAVALTAAGTYAFRAYIPMTVNATPGAQIAVGTSDTLTATSINYMAQLWNGTTITGAGTSTTLGTAAVAVTAAGTYATIDGVIVVNAAGTLTVKIAQNVSNATATSALVNGYLHVDRIA